MPKLDGKLSDLAPVAQELEARPLRHSAIEVIDYKPTADAKQMQLAAEGTITIYVAKKGSRVLGQLRAAAEARDGKDARLAERILESYRRRKEVPLKRAVASLRKAPVFASVRHGGRTVASSLFLPAGLDVSVVTLPYNGGKLAAEGLTLVEHHLPASRDALEAVALRHAPRLSAIERAAVRQVPASQREMNVGAAALCFALCLVAVAALVVLATGLCKVNKTNVRVRPAADRVSTRKVDAGATARRLIAERRRILGERA